MLALCLNSEIGINLPSNYIIRHTIFLRFTLVLVVITKLFMLSRGCELLSSSKNSCALLHIPAGRPDGKMQEVRQDGRHARRRLVGSAWSQRQVAPHEVAPGADVADCILLFGAFCNGEERETRNDWETDMRSTTCGQPHRGGICKLTCLVFFQ